MRRAAVATALPVLLLAGCGWFGIGGDAITVTVRNDFPAEVRLEITESVTQHPENPRTIAGPIVVPPGEHQVRLASPEPEWSLRLVGRDEYFDSQDLRDWQRQVDDGELRSFRLIVDDAGLYAETTPP